MSLWLIDPDNNRYDFISADLSGFPVDVRRKLIDLAFSHGAKDIADQKVGSRRLEVTTLLKGTTGGMVRMVDNYESVTHWDSITTDALAASLDTTYVKQGTYSMKCSVDYDKSGSAQAWWGYTGSAMDLNDISSDWIYSWAYFPTLDYLKPSDTTFRFQIGSDIYHHIDFNWTKAELSVGWNLLKCDLANPDSQTGTVGWSGIDYMWWGVDHLNTNDFDLYIDDLKVWRVSHQGEWDDLMRWIGRTDLKFYKGSERYINVESMELKNHAWIVGDAKSRATLALYCPDPFWYAEDEMTETTWNVSSSPDTNNIVNKGNIDVFPVIEITASADLGSGIELENQTDGSALFSYTDSNFTTGKKLTIDCVNGTVDLDGTNTFRFFGGQFIRLLAGSNTLEYTGGDCSIVIKHRDRWL
jgi:phage-related protein